MINRNVPVIGTVWSLNDWVISDPFSFVSSG